MPKYSGHAAYSQSKLAVCMLTAGLSRRLATSSLPVCINTVHPGIVNTGLYRHVNCLLLAVQKVIAPILFLTPVSGARCIVNVAVGARVLQQPADEIDGATAAEGGGAEPADAGNDGWCTGAYFHLLARRAASKEANNVGAQEQLWVHCIGQFTNHLSTRPLEPEVAALLK